MTNSEKRIQISEREFDAAWALAVEYSEARQKRPVEFYLKRLLGFQNDEPTLPETP